MLRRLSLIEACLRTKQTERAQVLFDSISHDEVSRPQLQRLVNMFIQQNVDLKHSLHWYSRCKQLKLLPDQQSQKQLIELSEGTPFANLVKKQLSSMDYLRQNLEPLALSKSQEELIEQQIEVEQASLRVQLEQLQNNKYASVSKDVSRLMSQWHSQLLPMIKKHIVEIKLKTAHQDNEDVGPFLLFFEKYPELLSAATVSSFVKVFGGKNQVNASSLVLQIGEAVQQEYRMKTMSKKKIVQAYVQSRDLDMGEWSVEQKFQVGAVLCQLLMSVANVQVKQQTNIMESLSAQPAFQHDFIYEKGKKQGIIKANEQLQVMLSESKASVIPKLLPMVVPPKPWVDFKSGGYLTIKTEVMRAMNKESLKYMQEATMTGVMDRIFGALDTLGQTKWRINDQLLQHVVYAWDNKMNIAKLPAHLKEMQQFEKPADYDTDLKVRQKFWQLKNASKQEVYDHRSLRASENYKIEIAKALVGKTLYFPHNIDFRGRAYPIPQLFNHMGNDLSRSLLVFDEKKPLGSRGFRWLQIHIANCYGHDKGTFDERVNFVQQNKSDILASAADPFNNKWWLSADKPWLTLSCCIEYRNALQSGSPESFESRLPIHQDGSCNGLQHYAALGGDISGARQVNLSSEFDRPQDVYSAVCDRVKKLIQNNMDNTPQDSQVLDCSQRILQEQFIMPSLQHELSKLITPDRIDRKVVKQTVMTSVYGVTQNGAKEQIYNRLKEKYHPSTFTLDQCVQLSRYLAPKVFQALDDTFTSARNIQNWLTISAKEVTKSVNIQKLDKYNQLKEHYRTTLKKQAGVELEMSKQTAAKALKDALSYQSALAWTTPLGLTVVQPYREQKGKVVATILQSFSLKNMDMSDTVDVQKQIAGFPPNFVHSLDATHMLMTAMECQKLKLTFASVHDSYWTHADDVDTMRTVLKQQFVQLHSQPILENLRTELLSRTHNRKIKKTYTKARYLELHPEQAEQMKNHKGQKNVTVWEDVHIPKVPSRGDFDINQVLDSEYFFN